MARGKEIVPNREKTQFSGEIAVECQKKSVAARKERANLRKALQTILDGEYHTKTKTGEIEERTGVEMVAISLFKVATDTKSKNCVQAQRLIAELTGSNKTDEEKHHDKLINRKLEAEIKAITEGTATLDPVQIVIQPREKNNESI